MEEKRENGKAEIFVCRRVIYERHASPTIYQVVLKYFRFISEVDLGGRRWWSYSFNSENIQSIT